MEQRNFFIIGVKRIGIPRVKRVKRILQYKTCNKNLMLIKVILFTLKRNRMLILKKKKITPNNAYDILFISKQNNVLVRV